MVFANTIGGVKRLQSLLELLQVPCFALHSSMQQRQRRKNLDRLRGKECILIATDIAARGLDVPAVQHVIHYQLPKTTSVRLLVVRDRIL